MRGSSSKIARFVRQGRAFVELFQELRGVRSKVRFCEYVVSGRLGAKEKHDGELLLDFRCATLCCGVGAGELYSYIEVFLKDDYQIGKIVLDAWSPVILDVGANIGVFALAAARRFPTAAIYALELNPKPYRRLIRNIELN